MQPLECGTCARFVFSFNLPVAGGRRGNHCLSPLIRPRKSVLELAEFHEVSLIRPRHLRFLGQQLRHHLARPLPGTHLVRHIGPPSSCRSTARPARGASDFFNPFSSPFPPFHSIRPPINLFNSNCLVSIWHLFFKLTHLLHRDAARRIFEL